MDNKLILQSRDMIMRIFSQAWHNARGAKDTSYLYDIMQSLKEYLDANGSFGITELDFSAKEYNVDTFEYTLVRIYRKCEKRFAEWSMIANEEIMQTLREMRTSDSVGYEDYIKHYNRLFKKYMDNGCHEELARRLITRDIREYLVKFSKAHGFTILSSIIDEKDYRTFQGLYTDVMTYTRAGDLVKAMFALADFKQTLENIVNRCEHLTKYEKYCLINGVTVGSHKDVKKRKSGLSGKVGMLVRTMIDEHLQATPYHQRITLKIFKPIKYQTIVTNPIIRASMLKPKLESSFPKKRRKKVNKAYKSCYVYKTNTDLTEKIMLMKMNDWKLKVTLQEIAKKRKSTPILKKVQFNSLVDIASTNLPSGYGYDIESLKRLKAKFFKGQEVTFAQAKK